MSVLLSSAPIGRGNRVRITFDRDGYAGTYRPIVRLHLSGPNGSPAGSGPKGWPRAFDRLGLFPYYSRGRWSSVLVLPCPYVSWATGSRFRRVGGFAVYRAVRSLYTRLGERV